MVLDNNKKDIELIDKNYLIDNIQKLDRNSRQRCAKRNTNTSNSLYSGKRCNYQNASSY